jgi:hypothetical protein
MKDKNGEGEVTSEDENGEDDGEDSPVSTVV